MCLLYFGLPLLHRRLQRRLLASKAARRRALVLTFDDGPGLQLTPAILDLLNEYDAKATFFLLGKNISGRESIVQRMAAEGHDVGTHGYGHRHYWKVNPIASVRDVIRGRAMVGQVLGNRGPLLFRPPYGKLNLVCLLYLLMRRVSVVYWTFALGDTRAQEAQHEDIADAVASLAQAPGAVVLVHDFDRRSESTRAAVLHAVRSVLQQARARNMPVLTVSELLSSRPALDGAAARKSRS